MIKPTIIILARYPELGKVKSRLAKEIGEEKALEIYRLMLQKTIDEVEASSLNYIFHWSGAAESFSFLPQGIPQVEGDLGEKMWGAIQDQIQPVIIIGTDCPDLNSTILNQASSLLLTNDIVFGPAHDGGYYLIAMKIPSKKLLEGILWSTSSVLQESIKICNREGLTFGLLPTLNDVDEKKDLLGTIYEKI